MSFIVGIGIAQLLTSFSEAIRFRIEHPLHWMPFVWSIPILLLSVQYWFGLFDLDSTLGDWNWFWYLQMLAMAMAVPALVAYRSRSNKIWIVSTFVFYVFFAITFFGIYSTPGSEEGFLYAPDASQSTS